MSRHWNVYVNDWCVAACQVMHLLRVLSETTSQSITEIMEPHKDILNEMIPPKKHLLRYQPANAQIGLMVCRHFFSYINVYILWIDRYWYSVCLNDFVGAWNLEYCEYFQIGVANWHIRLTAANGTKRQEITYIHKIWHHFQYVHFRFRKVYCLCKSSKKIGF